MISILIYLTGVIVCWIFVAWLNDNDPDEHKVPSIATATSWAAVIILLFCHDRFSKPSLKIFKRKKR